MDADRTSISSWSMMSGQNEHHRSTPIPATSSSSVSNGGDSLPTDSPLSCRVSPTEETATAASDADYHLLLDKISSLQEERLVLQEKVHMVEHSASAMAAELLRKNELIQYYCMEGGKTGKGRYPSSGLAAVTQPELCSRSSHDPYLSYNDHG
jgi:hypothetical protein